MKKQKTEYKEKELRQELKKKEIKAKKIFNNSQAMEKTLVKIDKKMSKPVKVLNQVIDEIKLLFNLVKDVIKKRYTEIPVGSLVAVLGALLYFLSPFDLAPDFLPLIGFTDDVAVILLVIKQIKHDLDKYKEWLKDKTSANR